MDYDNLKEHYSYTGIYSLCSRHQPIWLYNFLPQVTDKVITQWQLITVLKEVAVNTIKIFPAQYPIIITGPG